MQMRSAIVLVSQRPHSLRQDGRIHAHGAKRNAAFDVCACQIRVGGEDTCCLAGRLDFRYRILDDWNNIRVGGLTGMPE